MLGIRFQRTHENESFPFSDIPVLTLMSSLQNGEKCKFCFAVEDSKAENLSSSGDPGLCWGSAPNHSYCGYACCLTPTFQHLPRSMAPVPNPFTDQAKFGMQEYIHGLHLRAKFHPVRFIVSLLRSKKPKIFTVFSTSTFCGCAT